MAFLKRTWLARIGTGLNKFLIGDKDGEGKQTLTNSPDSVTQQGDVISAENLNDLEDRIETAVNANESAINGMRLTKIWENPSPSSSFASQNIEINGEIHDVIIVYRIEKGKTVSESKHLISHDTDSSSNAFVLERTFFLPSSGALVPNFLLFYNRRGIFYTSNGKTIFSFYNSYRCSIKPTSDYEAFSYTVDNDAFIPTAIYKVGDIYNS